MDGAADGRDVTRSTRVPASSLSINLEFRAPPELGTEARSSLSVSFMRPLTLKIALTAVLIACGTRTQTESVIDDDDTSARGAGGAVTEDDTGTTTPSSGTSKSDDTSSSSRPASDGGVVSGPPAFSKEAMSADIGYLAADERQGRFPGTQGDEETLAYIEKRFQSLGLAAPFAEGSYRQPFVGAGLKTANVAGVLPGRDPAVASEILVVGAHHDHRGVKGGKIQNGANDNASGVAAVLALAKAIREQSEGPRRTIVFTTFGYEENDDGGPCWGSEFFVHNTPAKIPADNFVYMMNLDMLGSYPDTKSLDTYGTFTGTAGRATLEAKRSEFPDVTFKLGGVPDKNDSDFQAFCSVGVPYVYFATDDARCYHKSCDDLDKIDFPSLISITKLAHSVVVDLANSSRDLKAGRRTTSTCKR